MFIRLYDARSEVNMLLSVREILAVKDYSPKDEPIDGANSVIMTRPVDSGSNATHNYFVLETVSQIETLILEALELSF